MTWNILGEYTVGAHTITVNRRDRHGEEWYQAVCSCGGYRSRWHGYRGNAGMAGREHAHAKAAAS